MSPQQSLKEMDGSARASTGDKSVPQTFQVMAARRAMDLNNEKLSGVAGGVKKVVRKQYSPGTQMLSQIKKLQNSTGNVMSVAPFTRIVHEFGQDIEPLVRIEPAALEGL